MRHTTKINNARAAEHCTQSAQTAQTSAIWKLQPHPNEMWSKSTSKSK